MKGAHRWSFFKWLWESQCRISRDILSENAGFKGIFFKDINSRIKMWQRTRKAFTLTFSQVLTVFWPGSAFLESYLLLGVAHLFVMWERWGVRGCCMLLDVVYSVWFVFPGGLWGCCSDSWMHLRATGFKNLMVGRESNWQDNFVHKLLLLGRTYV